MGSVYYEVCDVCNARIADEDLSTLEIQVGGKKHECSLCPRCQQTTSVFAAIEGLRTGSIPDEVWRRVDKPRVKPRRAPKPKKRTKTKPKPKPRRAGR